MIRDQKDINAFVDRMKLGRATAKAGRVSSTAPPKPVKGKGTSRAIPQTTKAAGDASPASPIPAPAKSGGKKPGSVGASIVHNHYYK